jgi:signal transduction histidine kinase
MASKTRTLPLAITLIFVACVSALLGAFGSIAFNLDSMSRTKAEVERSSAVVNDIKLLRQSLLQAELAQQGYLLTGNGAYLDVYRRESKRRAGLFGGLAQRLSDNRVQLRHLEALRDLTDRTLARLDEPLLAYERSGREAALEIARGDPGDRTTMDSIQATTDAMVREAEQTLEARNQVASRSYWITIATAMGVNLIAILVLTLFYSLTRRHFDRWIAAEATLQRHNENLEAVVAARTGQLSRLSRYLIRVTDSEKAKLARELHDELGSNLTAVNLDVAAVEGKLRSSEPALAQRLRRALDALRAVVDLSRRVIEDLRPSALDNMSLAEAMQGHCDEFRKRTGLPCTTELDEDLGEIDPSWSIALFRVVQESLTNAAKYAKPSSIRMSLRREEHGLRLRIVDDGVGIAADVLDQPLAHGVLGMRERISMLGGTFGIRRGENDRGTVVEAFLPFAADPQRGAGRAD